MFRPGEKPFPCSRAGSGWTPQLWHSNSAAGIGAEAPPFSITISIAVWPSALLQYSVSGNTFDAHVLRSENIALTLSRNALSALLYEGGT